MTDLTTIADELMGLLPLFRDGGSVSGRILPTEHKARFAGLIVDAKSIVDERLGRLNNFSAELSRISIESRSGFISGASYAAVHEAAQIIRRAVGAIDRREAAPLQKAKKRVPGTAIDEKLERAMTLRNGLVALCEGKANMDARLYRELRRELMQDPETAGLIPEFVRTSHDTGAVWAFVKDFNDHWDPRRQFVRDQFAPLIDHLERMPVLADTLLSDALTSFDAEGITAAWNKALARREIDPAGAITAARTLLETVCKHILEDANGDRGYDPDDDMPKLYRLASQRLNLAPSQHSEDAIKRILGGVVSVVEGIGTLRNKMGDAHAERGRKPMKPSPRHAALAVNSAGSVALFLIETAKERGLNV